MEALLFCFPTIFAEKIKKIIEDSGIHPDRVYNADQSGFKYELTGERSLAKKGVKEVIKIAQSKNATTHSFTILPIVSMGGFLQEKVLVTFQETGGKFGPQVQQTMIKPENLVFEATTSGIMNKKGLKTFIQDVFGRVASSEDLNLLLVDHWGPFTDKVSINDWMPDGKELIVENIPKNCTRFAQPFDVFGFRPVKDYGRRFVSTMKMKHQDIMMFQRNNQSKFISMLMNQFRSPRYIGLWQYAWYKAGYRSNYIPFESPVKFAFMFGFDNCCECATVANIRCAWCRKKFCLLHFFIDNPNYNLKYHYCSQYVN